MWSVQNLGLKYFGPPLFYISDSMSIISSVDLNLLRIDPLIAILAAWCVCNAVTGGARYPDWTLARLVSESLSAARYEWCVDLLMNTDTYPRLSALIMQLGDPWGIA